MLFGLILTICLLQSLAVYCSSEPTDLSPSKRSRKVRSSPCARNAEVAARKKISFCYSYDDSSIKVLKENVSRAINDDQSPTLHTGKNLAQLPSEKCVTWLGSPHAFPHASSANHQTSTDSDALICGIGSPEQFVRWSPALSLDSEKGGNKPKLAFPLSRSRKALTAIHSGDPLASHHRSKDCALIKKFYVNRIRNPHAISSSYSTETSESETSTDVASAGTDLNFDACEVSKQGHTLPKVIRSAGNEESFMPNADLLCINSEDVLQLPLPKRKQNVRPKIPKSWSSSSLESQADFCARSSDELSNKGINFTFSSGLNAVKLSLSVDGREKVEKSECSASNSKDQFLGGSSASGSPSALYHDVGVRNFSKCFRDESSKGRGRAPLFESHNRSCLATGLSGSLPLSNEELNSDDMSRRHQFPDYLPNCLLPSFVEETTWNHQNIASSLNLPTLFFSSTYIGFYKYLFLGQEKKIPIFDYHEVLHLFGLHSEYPFSFDHLKPDLGTSSFVFRNCHNSKSSSSIVAGIVIF